MARHPGGEGVDGHDAPGEPVFPFLFKVGVGHLQPPAVSGEPAVEVIGLAGGQGVSHVGLVEEGDVHRGGPVHHPPLGDVHALADVAGAEGLGHQGGEAHRLLQGEGGNVVADGAVLIVPGEPGQQVGHGLQPQPGQGLLPGGPHAGQGGEGGAEGEGFGHGARSFRSNLPRRFGLL